MSLLPTNPPRPSELASATREHGIDALRALAAIGVVQIHFGPFRGAPWQDGLPGEISHLATFLARFAVPFFLLTSGYLLARHQDPKALARAAFAQGRRLLFLFFAWSMIAMAFRGTVSAAHHRVLADLFAPLGRFRDQAIASPWNALWQGPEEPFWFLSSLAAGVFLYGALKGWRCPGIVVAALAVCLAFLGLASGAYGWLPLPGDSNPRNGLLVSFPLLVLGAALRRVPRLSLPWVLAGLVLSAGLASVELRLVQPTIETDPAGQDGLLGFFAGGVFLLMFGRAIEGRAVRAVAALGRLSLGIYACHSLVALIVIESFSMAAAPFDPRLVEGLRFVSICVLSTSAAWLLSRWTLTRPLVQ